MAWKRLAAVLLLLLATLASEVRAQAPPPEQSVVLEEIGKIVDLLLRGQHQGVLTAVDDFLGRHPLGPETFGVLLLKAQSQQHLSVTSGAIDSYQRALPFIERLHNVGQRRFVGVYFRLASLYRQQGERDRALLYVETGLTREPQNVYYQILQGELLRERGDRDQALKHFEAVLASPTPNAEERVVLKRKIDRLRPPSAAAAVPGPGPARLHTTLSIGLVPLNAPAASVSIADLCLLLESKWLIPCAELPPIQVDEATLLNAERGQYDAERVIQTLTQRYPEQQRPHRLVIALTGRDIFGPDTNYVFSWQSPAVGLGALSTYRFTAGLEDFYEPRLVAMRRVGIQLLSASGSMLGFTRPTRPDCPMAYPHDFREFLLKGSKLCDSEIEQRDALLQRTGGPTTILDAGKRAEIERVYSSYSFD